MNVLESGQIANMRTYRLPANAKIHVRILGADKTLCGRSLRNHHQWAWQFIHRDSGGRPSGMRSRDACSICSKALAH